MAQTRFFSPLSTGAIPSSPSTHRQYRSPLCTSIVHPFFCGIGAENYLQSRLIHQATNHFLISLSATIKCILGWKDGREGLLQSRFGSFCIGVAGGTDKEGGTSRLLGLGEVYRLQRENCSNLFRTKVNYCSRVAWRHRLSHPY